jgi:hypothetical protein
MSLAILEAGQSALPVSRGLRRLELLSGVPAEAPCNLRIAHGSGG